MPLKSLLAGLAAGLLSLSASAQAPEAPEPAAAPVEIMVLGVYHFDNPGLDLNNVEADNVLAERRQRELDVLGRTLASFKPTVVAIEARAKPPYVDENYPAFTPEDLKTRASESVQIGYRVAYLSGLGEVKAVDEWASEGEPDYFPYGKVYDFAERTGQTEALDRLADLSDKMAEIEQAQKTETIPQLLKRYNTGFISDDFYWDIIAFGEGEDQPGAELAAYWFMRNTKIFNKLQQVTKPGDRVLLVYGAGHVAWLEEIITRANGYEFVSPVPYLDAATIQLATGAE